MKNSLELLKQLKKSYDMGLVSALIGAGFTKNVYPKAVSWWELLKGIVVFTYDIELKQQYQQYKHNLKFWQCAKNYDDCLDKFVDIIIKRDGYLKVVSNYIKAKGCREAIDVYIEENNPFFYSTSKGTMVSGDKTTVITERDLATHKSFLECNWQQIFTTNYDNALEYISNYYHLNHEVIKCDYQLSSTKLHNSIIKIHGDLVNRDESLNSDYQFDNDKTRRYIISEEDYQTYPSRHQAFSYLLRIAMLSGTYCLIGFSGDDPNFLSWLEWVRDILDKENNKENTAKVFLISIDKKPIPKEKELFYNNHHIGVINLNDTAVQKELNINTPSPSTANLFQSLFAYLAINSTKPIIQEEGMPYNSLWQKVYLRLRERKGEPYADELVQIQKIQEKQFFNRNCYYQDAVFEEICSIQTPLTDEQKDALFLALNDLCKPLCQIDTSIQGQLFADARWVEYVEKQKTLLADEDRISGDKDIVVYQNVLRCLYRFDYKSAEQLLKEWTPSGLWLCRKASLNYIFDKEGSVQNLHEVESTASDLQIRYFAFTIRRYIDFIIKGNNRYQGIDGIQECVFYHINQLRQPKLDIQPYGNAEEAISYKDSIIEPEQKSLRFFHLLTSNGLNLTYSKMNVISVQDWYLAFRYLFVYYPQACLYYSSHYNNKKVLTRIGQDYAYSSSLQEELPKLLNQALKVLIKGSLPVFMRFGLLQICSRFFIAVDESLYYDAFKRYLKLVYFEEKGDVVYSKDAQTFVRLALNSLISEEKISEVLTLLLEYYKKNDEDASLLIVSHLRFNKLSKLSDNQVLLVKEILQTGNVNRTIYIANKLEHYGLFPQALKDKYLNHILGNQSVLSSAKMHPLACLCILAQNTDYVMKLKEEILSREYWGNVVVHSYVGDEQFFRFSLLPKEYIFSIEELTTISQKLESVFNGLVASGSINSPLFGMFYDDLLDEMDEFVSMHKNAFGESFLGEFKNSINSYHGFASLHQAFYGDTSEPIEKGIELIKHRLDRLKFAEIKEFYEIALNRVLFKHKTANTLLLDFVAVISLKFKKEVVVDPALVDKLLWLLLLYSHDDLRIYDFEVVDATLSFRLIAKVLRDAGFANQYVDWWLDAKENNRFNFVEIEW